MSLREELEDFYAEYSEVIDGGSQTVNDAAVPFAAHTEVVPADTLVILTSVSFWRCPMRLW